MALPSRKELLKLGVLTALRNGHDLPLIHSKLTEALNDSSGRACEPNIETEPPESKTALLRAVENTSYKYISIFMQLGADISHENARGETALSEAIKIGNRQMIEFLIEKGALLNAINKYDENAMTHFLRCTKKPDSIEWLLKQLNAPTIRPCDIIETIILGRHRVLCLLLDHDLDQQLRLQQMVSSASVTKSNVNEEKKDNEKEEEEEKKTDTHGTKTSETTTAPKDILTLLERIDPMSMRTPLMASASGGKSGTCIFLMDRGARPDQESPGGHTALTIASFFGHNETVLALLRNGGADINYETNTGLTALLQTCLSGEADTTRVLLINGADPNLQNKQSETAMTTAARCGHANVVMALLTGGAKINQETRSGRTPLHEALRCNQASVVQRLISDSGISLNMIPNSEDERRTPLMQAVACGSVEALKILLTKVTPKDPDQIGVDLYFETNTKQTALGIAILYGKSDTAMEVVDAMVQHTTYQINIDNMEFNQAVLSSRMLLSKFQRYLKQSKQHMQDLVARKESEMICQAAQSVTESFNEGVKLVSINIEDLTNEYNNKDVDVSEI